MLVDVFGFVYVFVPKVNWIDCILGVYDGLCGFGLDKCGAIRGVTILQIPQLDCFFSSTDGLSKVVFLHLDL